MRSGPLAVVLLLTVKLTATAQTVMTLDIKSASNVSHQTMYLAAEGLRSEGASAVAIFRPDQNVLYDMTPARQRYTRVTPERLARRRQT